MKLFKKEFSSYFRDNLDIMREINSKKPRYARTDNHDFIVSDRFIEELESYQNSAEQTILNLNEIADKYYEMKEDFDNLLGIVAKYNKKKK